MSEILMMKPVFTHNIWGGTRLHDEYGYAVEGSDIGECWGIAAHPNGDCEIEGGTYAGMKLSELYASHRELFGNIKEEVFPLLIKIIDANDDLSIQVHPDDAYAKVHENGSLGKTECWYILDCKEDAKLVVGHHATTKEELENMIHEGRWDAFIRKLPIKKGDFIQIDPGTVHAITAGCLILETQQNSDITYRVYDYDRLQNGKPRQLHVEQSIDVISVPAKDAKGSILETATDTFSEIYANAFYRVMKMNLNGEYEMEQKFPFLNASVLDGEGTLNGRPIHKGDHFIVPAGFGQMKFSGQLSMILSTVNQ